MPVCLCDGMGQPWGVFRATGHVLRRDRAAGAPQHTTYNLVSWNQQTNVTYRRTGGGNSVALCFFLDKMTPLTVGKMLGSLNRFLQYENKTCDIKTDIFKPSSEPLKRAVTNGTTPTLLLHRVFAHSKNVIYCDVYIVT